MALVVEDGTGLSNADSYVAVATVTAYLTSMKSATELATWTGSSLANQERYCRVATQYLDSRYNGRLPGTKINASMSLLWPRRDVWDLDGYEVDSESLPQKWKDACSELALRLAQGDTLLADVTEPGDIASESVTVGPISTSTTYVGGKSSVKRYPIVEKLLSSLLGSSSTVFTG